MVLVPSLNLNDCCAVWYFTAIKCEPLKRSFITSVESITALPLHLIDPCGGVIFILLISAFGI